MKDDVNKKKEKKPISVMMTHLPLLTKVFDESEGLVLEMGTGYFSTQYLNWLCSTFGRKLVSYDNNKWWGERAKKKYESSYHKIYIVDDWDKAKIDNTHWGLVFIDHSPKGRRHIDVIRLKDNADYIVMHDTEPEEERSYHYSKVYPYFKYHYDYTKIEQWTSVVSNFKDLKNFKQGGKMNDKVININKVMQWETFDFGEAMRKVSEGAKVRRLEWKNPEEYGVLKNGWLSIYRNGKMHIWQVSDGDMVGVDWVVVK